MTHEIVQIIYLNGPSSSGKTTLAKALQQAFETPFLHVGIDKIIGWMPEKVNDWTGGEAVLGYSWKKSCDETGNLVQELQLGPYAKKIEKTFHDVVVALARMGHHLIIDDVSFGKQEIDIWKASLKEFSVLWVGIHAPLLVLEQREKERGNRIVGSARGQFRKVHAGISYDLEIDTHNATPQEMLEKIKHGASTFQNRHRCPEKKLSITLCRATEKDQDIIQNLGRFYVYEMSRYCGFLSGWEVPANGLFECIDLSSYCEKPDRHAFLIKADGELAGFVLINKIGSTPNIDWNIGEFFVVSKFQGKGVGRHAAEQVFNQFPGVWETSQIPENKSALDFWETVVDGYTNGQYEKSLKTIAEPKPHPMVVLQFASRGKG